MKVKSHLMAIALLLSATLHGWAITLIDSQGRSTEVQLLSFDEEAHTVKFSRDKQVFQTNLDNLSDESGMTIRNWWADQLAAIAAEEARLVALQPGTPLPEISSSSPAEYEHFYGPMTLDNAGGGQKGRVWHHFDENGEVIFDTTRHHYGSSPAVDYRINAKFDTNLPVIDGHYKISYEMRISGDRADMDLAENRGLTVYPNWVSQYRRRSKSIDYPEPYVSDSKGLEGLFDLKTMIRERGDRGYQTTAKMNDLGWIEREVLLPGDIGKKGKITISVPSVDPDILKMDVKCETRNIRILVSEAPHPHGLRSYLHLPPLTINQKEVPFPNFHSREKANGKIFIRKSLDGSLGTKEGHLVDIDLFDGGAETLYAWWIRDIQQQSFLQETKETEYWYQTQLDQIQIRMPGEPLNLDAKPRWVPSTSTDIHLLNHEIMTSRDDFELILSDFQFGRSLLAYKSFPPTFAKPEAREHLFPALALGGWSQKMYPHMDYLRIRTVSGPPYGPAKSSDDYPESTYSHGGASFKIDLNELGGHENKFSLQKVNAIRVSYEIGSPGLEYLSESKWVSFVTSEGQRRDVEDKYSWNPNLYSDLEPFEQWGPSFKGDGTWRESFFYLPGHIGMWHLPIPENGKDAIESFRYATPNYDSMKFVLRNALGDVFIRKLGFERIVDWELTLFETSDLAKDIFSPVKLMVREPEGPKTSYLPMADTVFENAALTVTKPEGHDVAGIALSPGVFYDHSVEVTFALEVVTDTELTLEHCIELYKLPGSSRDQTEPEIKIQRLDDQRFRVEINDNGQFASQQYLYFQPTNLNIILPEFVDSLRVVDLKMQLSK